MERDQVPVLAHLRSCESSAGGGSYVCSKPSGHDGLHTCRGFGRFAGDLWASWEDFDADDEPMWCAHEEMEHADQDLRLCTRCGSVLLEVEDPNGTTWIDDYAAKTHRKVRYECAVCGVAGCRGCQPPPALRGWAIASDEREVPRG